MSHDLLVQMANTGIKGTEPSGRPVYRGVHIIEVGNV